MHGLLAAARELAMADLQTVALRKAMKEIAQMRKLRAALDVLVSALDHANRTNMALRKRNYELANYLLHDIDQAIEDCSTVARGIKDGKSPRSKMYWKGRADAAAAVLKLKR